MMRRNFFKACAVAGIWGAFGGGAAAEEDLGRVLIVFYSRRGENYSPSGYVNLKIGHTERIARMIADRTKGTLWEIRTIKAYPTSYRETTEVAKKELEENFRPALADPMPDLAAYDTVFIGHPIWWSDMPPAVKTFLDTADLSGKRVVQFSTNEGSGLGSSRRTLEELARGARFPEPFYVRGGEAEHAQGRVDAWLRKLGAKF